MVFVPKVINAPIAILSKISLVNTLLPWVIAIIRNAGKPFFNIN
jgi:hypothetical protein